LRLRVVTVLYLALRRTLFDLLAAGLATAFFDFVETALSLALLALFALVAALALAAAFALVAVRADVVRVDRLDFAVAAARSAVRRNVRAIANRPKVGTFRVISLVVSLYTRIHPGRSN
jgi:hypothetical protein